MKHKPQNSSDWKRSLWPLHNVKCQICDFYLLCTFGLIKPYNILLSHERHAVSALGFFIWREFYLVVPKLSRLSGREDKASALPCNLKIASSITVYGRLLLPSRGVQLFRECSPNLDIFFFFLTTWWIYKWFAIFLWFAIFFSYLQYFIVKFD